MMRVELTDEAYALYADLAASRGLTVSTYLDRVIRAQEAAKQARQGTLRARTTLTDAIRVHLDAGYDDGAISRSLNLTRNQVAVTRRALGRKPNKPKAGI